MVEKKESAGADGAGYDNNEGMSISTINQTESDQTVVRRNVENPKR